MQGAASTLLSPELDLLLQNAVRSQRTGSHSIPLFEDLLRTRELLARIEPSVGGGDNHWSLWLRTKRGSLLDFGDYDEYREAGEVESFEDFEALWVSEYPDEVQWRRLSIVAFDTQIHFFFEGELRFHADLATGVFYELDVSDRDTRRLVGWIFSAVRTEVGRCVADPAAYNREIAEQLPLAKRFGRIRRRDLWSTSDAYGRYDTELGARALARLERLVREQDDGAVLREMTLALYLEYCAIGYDANSYECLEPGMSPMQKYRAMADGRDEGLLDLPLRNPEAFALWFGARVGGGHPFEIRRGGNRTHIALHIVKRGSGWQLLLAGFSDARALETARMALALHKRRKIFVLSRAQEMYRMLSGDDFVGIVPDDIPLGYNQGDFPDEDRIHSFVHFYTLVETGPDPMDEIHWYPLAELRIPSRP